MATPPYSTSAQVQDTDLSRLVAQTDWANADVEDRIAEGDSIIQSCLLSLGYPITFASAAVTPDLVLRMSILYGRAASYRDLFHRSPNTVTSDSSEEMFKRFDTTLEKLKAGDLELIDPSTNLIIEPTPPVSQRVQSNTIKVPRALTMDEPENQSIDGDLYSNADVLGDPQERPDDC